MEVALPWATAALLTSDAVRRLWLAASSRDLRNESNNLRTGSKSETSSPAKLSLDASSWHLREKGSSAALSFHTHPKEQWPFLLA